MRSLVSLAVVVALCACQAEPARASAAGNAAKEPVPKLVPWSEETDPGWGRVDALVKDQKLEAASDEARALLDRARAANDGHGVTRALVRLTELRVGLHGFEQAVRFLQTEAWPADLLSQTLLHLYYAQALAQYATAYSWDLRRRERQGGAGSIDTWTYDQIQAEAGGAFAWAFARREALGAVPTPRLRELVSVNGYPQGIRPTVRDAVTYLWVQHLADSGGWRPEHASGVWSLDAAALARGIDRDALARLAPPALAGSSDEAALLASPDVHPLAKLAFALADLERWHAPARRGAALEAHLERSRRLHGAFGRAEDREAIAAELAAALPAFRGDAWWAEGMATLADLTRQSGKAGALVQARALAAQGMGADAAGPGGRRCASLVGTLDAPDLSLEASASDAPGRRSLAVTYKNLERVWFRAYRRDVLEALAKTNDFRLYDNDTARALLERGTPAATFSADLPRTVDLERHRAYVTPPMTAPGLYLVVVSAREDFGKSDNVVTGAHLLLGDLVVLLRPGPEPELEVEVLSGARGAAAPGVELSLLRYDYREGHRVVATARTGSDGFARVRRTGDWASYVVLARRGDDVAVKPAGSYSKAPAGPPASTGALVYTDRSIYRPGQTLHWKVVAYDGDQRRGQAQLAREHDVKMTLHDASGQLVAEATARTGGFGTAAGELVLPAGRLLGAWTLRASLGGQASVRVEEYKRPTFEAKLTAPAAARLGEPTTMSGEARYYFGLPVASGSVRWTVTREPLYPWWWSLWGRPGSSSSEVIATGTTAVGRDGTFALSFLARADPRLAATAGVSFRYVARAEVTDEGGETRSASRSVRVGFASVEASIELPSAFLRAGAPATASIHRSTLDGQPAPGDGVWTLHALQAPAEVVLPADEVVPPAPGDEGRFRTPGDTLPPRWERRHEPDATLRRWPVGVEKSRGQVVADRHGEARVQLPALGAGAYRLRYVTRDPAGAEVVAERDLLVTAPRTTLPLPLVVRADKGSVAVGDTARLLVATGFTDARVVVDFYRDGVRWDRRVLAGKEGGLIEVPVTAQLRGGFSVVASTVRDHQAVTGTARVFVPWDDKELRVELTTFRDELRPGERETWRVSVRGPGEKDQAVAAAELLAYMYDRSLDAFVPHVPPRPIDLFPDRTAARGIDQSLGLAPQAWFESGGFPRPPSPPVLEPDRLRALSRHGVGGPGRRGGIVRSMAPGVMPAPMPAAPAHAAVSGGALRQEGVATHEAKPPPPAAPEAPAGEAQLRGDFSETAFFSPRLITDRDGTATIELTVPESVTSWRLWVHALTKDFASGSVAKEARTVKELMVRPYLPRFLREGDAALLRVAVNNAGDQPLTGELRLELVDPATQESVAERFGLRDATRRFTALPKGAATVSFAVTTPGAVGLVAVRATARAGALSDGEQRPVPVLPGRMHLTQSRFATLQGPGERTLRFADLAAGGDPSRVNEQLVVTLDAQLFHGVLAAVPYLVDYPYECTEQTLNRYLSTAVLGSLFDRYPAVARFAGELALRTTRFERFDAPDPTRRMALEETPWLTAAKGGDDQGDAALVRVLDPAIARAQREASLARLEKLQTASGGFPWFPGGPPSPYMTLYLLQGFARGVELGVAPPATMVQHGLAYLHRHWLDELVRRDLARGAGFERVTFLAFVLSAFAQAKIDTSPFTDADRARMLDHGFTHWREHSPYLKGYLALTLGRAGRAKDAELVWASVMDSARTAEDQGTFWAPEARSWLWYNDTIETHAFALRVAMELTPADPRLPGLVTWLFLNKKLNHWKSTRATAEVLYSLSRWLSAKGDLGRREEATVSVGGEVTRFVFEPDRYTGKRNQIVRAGAAVDARAAKVVVTMPDPGLVFASATWSFSTDRLPTEARGDFLTVERRLFRRVVTGREPVLEPLSAGTELAIGDEVVVQLAVTSKHPAEYIHLRDPRPAGFEPVEVLSGYRWDVGPAYYQEVRDSGTNFFFDAIPQGTYTLSYRLRAAHAGTFKMAPATLQPMYAPEFAAYSAGATIPIAAK